MNSIHTKSDLIQFLIKFKILSNLTILILIGITDLIDIPQHSNLRTLDYEGTIDQCGNSIISKVHKENTLIINSMVQEIKFDYISLKE